MRVMPFAWLTLIGAVTTVDIQACSSVETQEAATSTGSGGHGGGGTSTAQTATATSSVTSTATAAVSSSAASSSSTGGGTMCGSSLCADASLLGFVTLPGCCPANAPPDKCGLDLTSVAQFIGVSLGCFELNQPGDPDASCPDQQIAAMGQMLNLPGCCRPDMVCGNVVDLSAFAAGVNFGCADASPFIDGGAPKSCGGGTGSSAASSGSGTGSSGSGTGSSGSGTGSSGSGTGSSGAGGADAGP